MFSLCLQLARTRVVCILTTLGMMMLCFFWGGLATIYETVLPNRKRGPERRGWSSHTQQIACCSILVRWLQLANYVCRLWPQWLSLLLFSKSQLQINPCSKQMEMSNPAQRRKSQYWHTSGTRVHKHTRGMVPVVYYGCCVSLCSFQSFRREATAVCISRPKTVNSRGHTEMVINYRGLSFSTIENEYSEDIPMSKEK